MTAETSIVAGLGSINDRHCRLVILGCGYAGALIVKRLEAAIAALPNPALVQVTIIDQHEVMWMKISGIRATVSQEWVEKTAIPIRDIIKTSKFVCGRIEEVEEPTKMVKVRTPSGALELVPFDILLCATGTLNGSPSDLPPHVQTLEDVKKHLTSMEDTLAAAKNILIVGGGATSIELAGEMREKYPEKKITIVSASTQLLSSCVVRPSKRFFRTLHSKLRARNINILLEHRVTSPSAKDFQNASYLAGERKVAVKGKDVSELDADLVIWAGSWKFNNSMYPESWLNDMGEVKLADTGTFQTESREDVYVFGDISSLCETKQAITLPGLKVEILVNNLLVTAGQFLDTKFPKYTKLQRYSPTDKATMYLPIGSKDGVSYHRGWTFGGSTTAKWKGRKLFTDKFWSLLADKTVAA